MEDFEIWMEGHSVTGSHCGAQLLAVVEGVNFKDAVLKFMKGHITLESYFKEYNLSVWSCRLYDNEADARKSFG